MNQSIKLAIAAMAFLGAGVASAVAADNNKWSIGVGPSTGGLSVDLGYRDGAMGIRGQVNAFSISHDFNIDNVDLNGKLSLFSLGVIGDYYIGDNGFRISGGAFYNDNHVEAKAKANGQSIEFGGTTYTAEDFGSVSANLRYNKINPYVGMGYVFDFANFGISVDAGILYQGKPDINFSTTSSSVTQASLDNYSEKVRNEAEKLPIYPLVSVKLVYRF